jgi:hypothetical protein
LLSFLTEAETLAAADEQPGRRNWSKCRVFTDVTATTARLFQSDCMTQAAVSKLHTQDSSAIPAIASCIDALLLEQKKGMDVQAQLDAALTVSLLPSEMQLLFVSQIKLRPEHLLHADMVQDIGYIVRDIMMMKQRNEVLFKLYQYTMPFIKHNRLNFPPMQFTSKTVLMHMTQVMALSCLGLYSPQHKKPTWNIRRQLFVFFTNLHTRGSARDIYIFCQNHTYMLRLALMEHFVYFTSKHMALEMPLLLRCTGTFYDHERTQRLVQYITDHFRTAALQNETLDWSLVESKAQLSVERCNRTCKSQQLLGREKHTCVADTMSAGGFRCALSAQRVDPRSLPQIMGENDMLTVAARWGLSQAARKYSLPVLLQHKQFAHIERMSLMVNNRTVVSRSLLHVCLRCNQKHPHAKGDMRIQFPDKPICKHCNSSAYVCVADTLGHLVRVYSNYYYFCIECSRVHIWRGTGNELGMCPWGREQGGPRRHCAVCLRNVQLISVCVFDKALGIMQNFFLCHKHSPPAPLMRSVHDLAALRCLVRHLA